MRKSIISITLFASLLSLGACTPEEEDRSSECTPDFVDLSASNASLGTYDDTLGLQLSASPDWYCRSRRMT